MTVVDGSVQPRRLGRLTLQPDLGAEHILTREYLPTVLVNSVVAAIITPLVVRFWAPLHDFFEQPQAPPVHANVD